MEIRPIMTASLRVIIDKTNLQNRFHARRFCIIGFVGFFLTLSGVDQPASTAILGKRATVGTTKLLFERRIAIIESLATRVWLSTLLGKPLSMPKWTRTCRSDPSFITRLSNAVIQYGGPSLDRRILLPIDSEGEFVWPFPCRPVDLVVVKNTANVASIVLHITAGAHVDQMIKELETVFKTGNVAAVTLTDERVYHLREAYTRYFGIENKIPLPLIGHPALDKTGGSATTKDLSSLRHTGFAIGDYKLTQDSARLTIEFAILKDFLE